MTDTLSSQAAIEKGTAYLGSRQRRNGSFDLLISSDPEMRKNSRNDATVFSTCLVAYCLGFIRSECAVSLRDSSCSFLASQKEGSGFWRFWTRKRRGYPHIALDVDDTACAAFLLRKFRNGAKINNRSALFSNRNEKGLFYTWLFPRLDTFYKGGLWNMPWYDCLGRFFYLRLWMTSESNPGDIAPGVNANVLLYLGEGEYVKPVSDWLEAGLADEKGLRDAYYDPLAVYYMISRAYSEGVRSLQTLVHLLTIRITDEMNRLTASRPPLFTALAACSLLNIGFTHGNPLLEKAVQILLESQEKDGSWPAAPIFWGGFGRSICWGSPEVSTAMALEALARHQNLRANENG